MKMPLSLLSLPVLPPQPMLRPLPLLLPIMLLLMSFLLLSLPPPMQVVLPFVIVMLRDNNASSFQLEAICSIVKLP
jgi:hypothetical protein